MEFPIKLKVKTNAKETKILSQNDDEIIEALEYLKSDIDIAVIGRKEKQVGLIKFEKELERKININFYDSFKNIHKHLKENLCNGIILIGGVEL